MEILSFASDDSVTRQFYSVWLGRVNEGKMSVPLATGLLEWQLSYLCKELKGALLCLTGGLLAVLARPECPHHCCSGWTHQFQRPG